MRRLISLLVATLFFSTISLAAEQNIPPLERSIEVPNFIVNYSLSGQIPGRVLASLCSDCPQQTLTFDQNTLLEIDGQLYPIEDLKQKVEWSGLLTVTNLAPTHIIKFTIY